MTEQLVNRLRFWAGFGYGAEASKDLKEAADFIESRASAESDKQEAYEYAVVEGPRKGPEPCPPDGEGWEPDPDAGRPGKSWDRFDNHEEYYYRRKISDKQEAVDADSKLDRDQIRAIFMTHGFTIKEGQTDLKEYVYRAAEALLNVQAALESRATAESGKQEAVGYTSQRHLDRLDERHPVLVYPTAIDDWTVPLYAHPIAAAEQDRIDALLNDHIELNMANYDSDDVSALNEWAIRAYNFIKGASK